MRNVSVLRRLLFLRLAQVLERDRAYDVYQAQPVCHQCGHGEHDSRTVFRGVDKINTCLLSSGCGSALDDRPLFRGGESAGIDRVPLKIRIFGDYLQRLRHAAELPEFSAQDLALGGDRSDTLPKSLLSSAPSIVTVAATPVFANPDC